MQHIKGIENYQNAKPSAITLGKFDGLHQGHELLVERIIQKQEAEQLVSVVVAFDMRPLFQKLNKEFDHLLTGEEKAKRLDGRIDYFVECPFVDEISQMEAEDFIQKILVDQFHAKYIVVGTQKPQIRITASVLNVRASASTGATVVAQVKRGNVYILHETNGKWGRIDKGWVYLPYTEKV